MTRRTDLRELAAIFVGGMAGALARVWISEHLLVGTRWPWAIFLINLAGAAVLAVTATLLPRSVHRRALIGIGFCGAFTTFSTMEIEILTMLDDHAYGRAAGYAAASVLAGLLVVWTSTALVRRRRRFS